MKSLVIVNPQAGSGKTGRTWSQWKTRIQAAAGSFDEVFTEGPGHGETLARQALLEGYTHIHAVGGDGTATEILGGFFQRGRTIRPEALFTVWPAGTACDFHRGLQLSDTFKNRGTESTLIDVGRLTYLDHDKKPSEKYFLNITSCGISGFVDQLMAKQWKKLGGRLGFLINTIEGLMRYDNRRVRIRTDRGDMGEMLIRMAVVANGKYFGAGMKIAPDAKIDDGKFQLVILGDISVMDALIHTPQLYAGQHMGHPKIQTQNVTWVELTSEENVLLDLDGEPFGTLPLRVQVVPNAIRLKTY